MFVDIDEDWEVKLNFCVQLFRDSSRLSTMFCDGDVTLAVIQSDVACAVFSKYQCAGKCNA